MEFREKKIPYSRGQSFKKVTLKTVQPHVILFAPAYVLMKKDQFYVGVKGPLDFFTPEDLTRLSGYEFLHFSRFIFSIGLVRDAARAVQNLLKRSDVVTHRAHAPVFRDAALGASDAEISSQVLRVLTQLWLNHPEEGVQTEAFFVCAFVDELLGGLSPTILTKIRAYGVDFLERVLVLSSLSVFMMIHLGYLNLAYLNRLRIAAVFALLDEAQNRTRPLLREKSGSMVGFGVEAEQVFQFVCTRFEGLAGEMIRARVIATDTESLTKKFSSRLPEILNGMKNRKSGNLSIFGEDGFA